ncbi:ABC transporter ATP-binding protein/permease [Mycoplasmatota bacterium]|nr:ABC transporter ATP-binding protein/permease [Mycoplasmatota bacterium]
MHHEDDQDVQVKVNLNTWKKILRIILKSKKRMVLLILFSGLLAILDTAIPFLNAYAIDNFFVNGDYTNWPYFATIYAIMAFGFGLSIWGFIRQAGMIEAETSYELRKQAFENIQNLSYSYFDKTPHGWIMARMTSDARKLSLIISWGLVDFVWAGLSMFLILIVLFVTYAKLALVVTAFLPFMFLIAFIFQKVILKKYREAKKFNSQMTAQYNEGFQGAKTTKSLTIEKENYLEFEDTARKYRSTSVRAQITTALFSSLILIIAYIAVSLTMIQGSVFVLDVLITLGVLQMFIAYTINFFEPIMAISQILSDFQNAQASAERIVGLIETESSIVDRDDVIEKYGTLLEPKTENWEPLIGEVEFKHLTFYYNDNEMIFKDFNIHVNAGEAIALVGHTGSGKTSFVNLLSRFYEPVEGQILIDGVDYRERSIHWLHKRLGYVLQSPQLFSTSVLENIRYGRLDATDEEVIDAAKAVGIDKFVKDLEKGYQTFVGEGGNLLSVGQKQLISFARAILADPSILILDEATSSIDSETEEIIQEATHKLLKNRTSFIVAHRLSTIVSADKIVMLEMGKIIEMGSHDELIAQRGKYFNLYKNQFLKEKEEKLNI